MRSRILLCVLSLFISVDCLAQSDFFWSGSDLNDGAVNATPVLGATVGETRSIFLYYSTNGTSNSELRVGALFNVRASEPGVVRFTAAETFNFELLVATTSEVFSNRWRESSFGGVAGNVGTVTDNQIVRWGAFSTLTGEGIDEDFIDGPIVDSGYDPQADAFLFGRVDFEVIGDGTVDLLLETEAGLVVDESCFAPVVGGARVSTAISGEVLLGDTNGDNVINLLDVAPFIDLLANQEFQAVADINGDGAVNLLDVQGFVTLLVGPDLPDSQRENCVDQSTPPNDCVMGDLNMNNVVDLLDDEPFINLILTDTFQCEGDFNEDGEVNLFDVLFFRDLFNF